MKRFFGDDVLLDGESAKIIYDHIKNCPIIDYHCHLDEKMIAENSGFENIGRLWLSGDHYKWRAMRLCGVDEEYITGGKSDEEKFFKYAEILPKLVGNPLYYWTHLELKLIFGIGEPLSKESAPRIWKKANDKLAGLRVGDLLKQFRVEFVATTDDPLSPLSYHGTYGGTRVAPTFRPDRLYTLDESYLKALAECAGTETGTLDGLLAALQNRLDFFISKGCRISDHGFERFPRYYATHNEAQKLYLKRKKLSKEEKERFFGFLLVWLAKEYKRRNMLMQIHFSVIRNVNTAMFAQCGADSGFDLIGEPQDVRDLVKFLDEVGDCERPKTVIYTLNDANLTALIAATGAFRNVKSGAAWWFNDTVEGIRRNLKTLSEYAALGTHFGMLTDSRSFSSYVRFDFFRRILASHLGRYSDRGECTADAAIALAEDVCYHNIKEALEL